MKSKVFLDTNVIIDFLETTRKRNKEAIQTIAVLVKNDCDIFISEDMLTTISYIVKKKREVLAFFQEILAHSNWHIVPFGTEVIKNAIAYTLKSGSDLEDVLQCFCAKEHKCDIFLTNDKKFVDCGVEILDYDTFLKDRDG